MSQSRSQSTGFLQDLFGSALPDGTRIALWSKPDKRSIYLADAALAAAHEGQTDVYVTAGLAPEGLSASRRLKARECAGIPGVWVDADVNGGPDNKVGVCPDRAAAETLTRVELEPTLLVNSGYGIQAWWLFDDPLLFGMPAERERAARVTQGWETIHRNHARRKGHGLDSTHDLARLMRLPGTVNGKGGLEAEVTVISDDGPRYSFDTIAERALTVAALGVQTIKVDLGADFPQVKFDALIENHDFFRKTWSHQRKDREAATWSMSEFDLSLATIAVSANWSDDEIGALIREHRLRQGDDSGKGTRADYLQKTIEKARTRAYRVEQERTRHQAFEEVTSRVEAGTSNADFAYSKFNQVLGAGVGEIPVTKELVQYSSDPDEARYVLVFDNGQEVNVGSYENLREPRKLDRRLGPATGMVIEVVKDNVEWRTLIGEVLKYRTLIEDPEPQIVTWLQLYVSERRGASREEAARHGEPFEEAGMVYVKTASFARFIRTALRDQVKAADLPPMLRARGFAEHRIEHEKKAGDGLTVSSYWAASKREFE